MYGFGLPPVPVPAPMPQEWSRVPAQPSPKSNRHSRPFTLIQPAMAADWM